MHTSRLPQQVALSLAFAMLLILSIAVTGLNAIDRVHQQTSQGVQQASTGLVNLQQSRIHLLERMSLLRQSVLERSLPVEALKRLDRQNRDLQQAWSEAGAFITSPAARGLSDHFRDLEERYARHYETFFTALRTAGSDSAANARVALAGNDLLTTLEAGDETIAALVDLKRQEADTAVSLTRSGLSTEQRSLMVWTVLAMLVGLLLTVRVSRRVRGLVKQTTQSLTDLVQGDFETVASQNPIAPDDRLNQALRTLALNLQHIRGECRQIEQNARTGHIDLALEISPLNEGWRHMLEPANTALRLVSQPLTTQTEALQGMARGTLTTRAENGKGEHQRVSDAINQVAESARRALVEIEVMVQASREGDLGKRVDATAFEGDWRQIMQGINSVLDQAQEPVQVQTVALRRMAEGHLTAAIDQSFNGDHNRINEAINRVGAIAGTAMTEINQMIEASREGNLSRRADVSRFVGNWHDIFAGINTLLDEALKPVEAQAQILQNMAAGQLTSRIDASFKGDHNRTRNAINRVAELAGLALQEFENLLAEFTAGNLTCRAKTTDFTGDWLRIMQGLNEILANVQRTTLDIQNQNWIKTGLSELADVLRGDMQPGDIADTAIRYIARYVDAQAGAIYLLDEDRRHLTLKGSFAYELRKGLSHRFALGEGLVGQVALEKRLISVTRLPDDFSRIISATGDTLPRNVVVLPLIHEDQLKGVLELARIRDFETEALDWLRLVTGTLSVALHTAEANEHVRLLLEQTQEQAQQLQVQQEELLQSNEELEEQTQMLRASEEELHQTNAELEQRTLILEQQASEIAEQNRNLEGVKNNLRQQAEDLELASRYKSEFLANMSHELRTPLNSMLLLSRSLADNREGNLNDKQVQAARVMYQSGSDLLGIINDILDLSKIEAGRETILTEAFNLKELVTQLAALYQHVAEEKNLELLTKLDPRLPPQLISDRQRVGQILRNLLSNAFKFTHEGSVTLAIHPVARIGAPNSETVETDAPLIAFAVIDTGVGIPPEKQKHIWEAFQQADGSTSREYGGTGLGLTISRELAKLLGGDIRLVSEPGKGTAFTLYLPLHKAGDEVLRDAVTAAPPTGMPPSRPSQALPLTPNPAPTSDATLSRIEDDRDHLNPGEGAILIVEDDRVFARTLADLCREHGTKYLASPTVTEALELLSSHTILGVILDMNLPDNDGWPVLTRIKEELDTLHIPVYVISSEDRNWRTLHHGAVGFLQKPVMPEQLREVWETVSNVVNSQVKTVLLIEDDATLRAAIHDLLDAEDVHILHASDGHSALQIMNQNALDLIILDLGLPDMSGFQWLEQARQQHETRLPPVIVFTGRDLNREEYEQLQRYAAHVIIKGVRSDERLVQEAALFLHRKVAGLPERARQMLSSLHDRDALFTGKTLLLVDDDIRNIFSLSGLLEDWGFNILTARNGQEAVEQLTENPEVDLLLTDIMMPVMDGYALIEWVRSQEHYNRLPILALTAKAMREDRDRCLAAGASDYLTKPIDIDRLIAMMRVWLYR